MQELLGQNPSDQPLRWWRETQQRKQNLAMEGADWSDSDTGLCLPHGELELGDPLRLTFTPHHSSQTGHWMRLSPGGMQHLCLVTAFVIPGDSAESHHLPTPSSWEKEGLGSEAGLEGGRLWHSLWPQPRAGREQVYVAQVEAARWGALGE